MGRGDRSFVERDIRAARRRPVSIGEAAAPVVARVSAEQDESARADSSPRVSADAPKSRGK